LEDGGIFGRIEMKLYLPLISVTRHFLGKTFLLIWNLKSNVEEKLKELKVWLSLGAGTIGRGL
jgi:hypothetical protein